MTDIDSILAAFSDHDFNQRLLNKLRQHRSDPGTAFDEAMYELEQRIEMFKRAEAQHAERRQRCRCSA